MNKPFFLIVSLFFPFVDFLYILQLEEYDFRQFFKWIRNKWWKRNFQKVGQVIWTKKLIILFAIAVILYLVSIIISFKILNFWYLKIIGLILVTIFIPLHVILAALIFLPVDIFIKRRIINKARQKLGGLSKCIIITIAGSHGKSTTRFFLFQILQNKYNVHTPDGNINTFFGLAQDILKNLNEETEVYVVEFGESRHGDFKKFFKLISRQTIAVLTAVGSQHLSLFGSQDAIDQEFLFFLNLTKAERILVNDDNEGVRRVAKMCNRGVEKYSNEDVFSFLSQESLPDSLKIEHIRQNAGAAVKIAKILNIETKTIKERLYKLETFERRVKLTKVNDILIIDDSYNINPESARAALEYLSTFYDKRKILITGGIVEQGEYSLLKNLEYGIQISKIVDVAIVANNNFVNPVCQGIKKSEKKLQIIISKHPAETQQILQRILKANDVILIQNELPDLYWN